MACILARAAKHPVKAMRAIWPMSPKPAAITPDHALVARRIIPAPSLFIAPETPLATTLAEISRQLLQTASPFMKSEGRKNHE